MEGLLELEPRSINLPQVEMGTLTFHGSVCTDFVLVLREMDGKTLEEIDLVGPPLKDYHTGTGC